MHGSRPSRAPNMQAALFIQAAFCCLGLAGPGLAGTLYQCDGGGVRVYSDRPCGPGARTLEVPDAPAPGSAGGPAKRGKGSDEDRRIAAWARESQRRLPASLGGAARGGASKSPAAPTRKSPEPDPCADARKALAAAEARGPLDFRQLRQHGDRIWAACSK